MKVVALIGSFREKSYNRAIFNFYKTFSSDDVSIEEGVYRNVPFYDDDLRQVGIPAEVQHLVDQIRNADGVIFFSPEYNYSVPGPLKNVIDWLSKVPHQPFAAKPVAIIGASPGRLGTARMQYHLRQMGVFLDMRFLNKPEVMISEVHKLVNEGGELTDETTQKFLRSHFESFIQFAKQIK